MHATLSAALRHVLMEHGRVCLPGIGTLLVTHQPALVSLIERKAVPPSAMLGFNANLVLDDGRLRQHLADSGEGDYLLDQVRQQLADGQVVPLEGIGKLYPYPSGEFRFAPTGDNFNKESYGLPAVTVQPILRKEKPVTRAAASARQTRHRKSLRTLAATQAPRFTAADRRKAFIAVGVMAGLLALILLLGRVFFGSKVEDRPVPATLVEPPPPPALPRRVPTVDPPPPPVTEATSAPRHTAIIAIGLYGRKRNVAKQEGRIREAGYVPVSDPEGRNTRVGVEFKYAREEELRAALRDLRDRFTEEAFVMRLDGELRRPE